MFADGELQSRVFVSCEPGLRLLYSPLQYALQTAEHRVGNRDWAPVKPAQAFEVRACFCTRTLSS